MGRVTRDAWKRSTLKTREVEVEELGGSVLVRELPAEYSAEVASKFEMRAEGRDQVARVDTATMERLQFAYGVVDDDGEPLFTEDEVKEIGQKHGRAFRVVVAVIDEMSGIDKEAIEKAEARFPSQRADEIRGAGSNGPAPGDTGPDVSARTGAGAGDEPA